MSLRERLPLQLCRTLAAVVVAFAALATTAQAAELAQATGRIEVDAMEYPWSAIGRVNAGGRGHCTGFLVGKRHVLTAAHCLYDPRDGRWRSANEIHFVAGYQRDAYLIHSPVLTYERSQRFRMNAGASVANAVADWAVLTLAEPIGRKAGWLGLRHLDGALRKQIARGEARALQAGYRRGWAHIMSVGLDCRIAGLFEGEQGILHDCDVAQGDSGSPLLVAADGTLRVAGLHVLNTHGEAGKLAGVLSVSIFGPDGGTGQAVRALKDAGAAWSGGRAPGPGGPAAAVPVATIDRLLAEFGRLKPAARALVVTERGAAIADFEAAVGLPVTGAPSLPLLAQLIQAL